MLVDIGIGVRRVGRQYYMYVQVVETFDPKEGSRTLLRQFCMYSLYHCFSTAGPLPDTGPWYQLYRSARGRTKRQYATRFH